MKRFLLLSLLVLSFNAEAEKIVLKGDPVVLNVHPGYFKLPDNYIPRTKHHYVMINKMARVCFIETQPELESLEMIPIILEINDRKLRWYCYLYNPAYFEVDY